MPATQRIGFIGAGRMATALARGLVASGFTTADRIVAGDVSGDALRHFTAEIGGRCADSNVEVCSGADVVILAVKPQQMSAVLAEIAGVVTHDQLMVSIAAGVPIAALAMRLGTDKRIVRVMPNTPALVGAGAAGFALGGAATEEDAVLVERLFSTVGLAVQVPEAQLDAVTGLSGSGPAYAFLMIEALSDGGVRCGLPRDVATRLAAQTLLGAAKMVLETGEHPGRLKDAVTSPGGTTIAGLAALERGALRGCLIEAVTAATDRSRELGRL
ncbi:MAG: pyrroline-5-carboxylate reductase [Planctomycetaceae bacterium]